MPTPTAWQQTLSRQLQHLERELEAIGDLTDLPTDEPGIPNQKLTPVGREGLIRADNSLTVTVREHLRRIDPGFAALQRVRTSQGYRWVHSRFVEQYRLPLPEIPTD
jgi:hypothetical protein